MKKLEELGISPAPWGFGRASKTHYAWIYCDDRLRGGAKKSNMFFIRYPYFGMMDERRVCREQTANARLIAAAPKLYECLHEAAELRCGMCDVTRYAQAGNDMTYFRETMCPKCKVYKWRAALAEAAGEEADND